MISAKKLQKIRNKILKTIDIPKCGKKYQGKVRDYYKVENQRVLITTDRISAFDRVFGYIPYKGQVLNQLSAFWFGKTKEIVSNHMIDIPHPSVMIAKDTKPYPVEMVVRGYITGVTSTSIWYSYERGERTIYGIKFPENLRKNQQLPKPVLTPTTKAEHGAHDERLTHAGILKQKLVSPKILQQMEEVSLALYKKGNEICQKRGLILVDTKYEFGEYKGKLILIDEIHTPDSSRFWKADDYQERFEKGREPENFDKEFFRIWYVKKGYRGDGKPPAMPTDLQAKTAMRYIKIYEMITGKRFNPEEYPLENSVKKSIIKYFNHE